MTTTEQQLTQLATQVGERLQQRGLLLVTAESCTGGWLGQAITAVAGSSAWYDRGFITYSNRAKCEMLHVNRATLEAHGAVSEQTAQEMAFGALKMSCAHVSVSITGIAGPSGGSDIKPIGTICFTWVLKEGLATCETHHFNGDRDAVRSQSVLTALQGILNLLDDMPPLVA
ncbi:MAG: nicotinamide-nucleotide amidohydrolase family protein [Betaproteobacteria bacterium]|nr:nicotinamide-nucleotide amidohydrolase family protein [Betaproteobacteria bacterium]